MTIEEKKDLVIKKLTSFTDWEDRYRQILSYAKKLPLMNDQLKTDEFLVKGCQSKVWLWYEFNQGKVIFLADSDGIITKGIIGLLVYVYSGQTPQEILSTPFDFLKEVGITEHLSSNRRNGLANMCKLIQTYAQNCQEK